MSVYKWTCVDSRCGQDVYAGSPDVAPSPICWSDGHICTFKRVEEEDNGKAAQGQDKSCSHPED